jgi:hypothetical protein
MKTYVHLYLAEFFLDWDIFQIKVVDKIKTHILCSINFFRKSCRSWDNAEKYGRARQATDDNIIQRMRFACSITKATDTHSEYVILIAFPRQQWLRERASLLRLYIHSLRCCSWLSCHNSDSALNGLHSRSYCRRHVGIIDGNELQLTRMWLACTGLKLISSL